MKIPPSCFFLLLSFSGIGQASLHFENISVEDGLSDSDIASIFQDNKGFMWFGSQSGLNRYDGLRIKNYIQDPDQPELNYPKAINNIIDDKRGNLLLTGEGEFFLYDPVQDSFEMIYPRNSEDDDFILNLFEDRDGELWLGTYSQGLMKFDWKSRQFIPFATEFGLNATEFGLNIQPKIVNHLLEDHSGDLWFSYPNRLYQFIRKENNLKYYDFRENKPRTINDLFIKSIYEDSDQNIWVGTARGLFRFDRTKREFFPVPLNKDGSDPGIFVRAPICEGPDGHLWIGAGGLGLYRLNLETNEVIHHPELAVRCIYKDSQGGMWVGTFNRGVLYWSENHKAFRAYYEDYRSYADDKHEIWLEKGTEKIWYFDGAGISLIDSTPEQFLANPKPIYTVVRDKIGRLWRGNWNGLIRADIEKKQVIHYSSLAGHLRGLPDNATLQVFIDQQGIVWVGVWGSGLYRYDPQTDSFHPHELIDPSTGKQCGIWNRAFYEDRDQNLWIGADQLIKLNRERSVVKVYNTPTIFQICEGQRGTLWLGTHTGLYNLDVKSDSFRFWRKKDGLPDNRIYAILADDKNRLWLGTHQGLSCFDPQTNAFRNYDRSDGLPSDLFKEAQFMKTPSGDFWFALKEGALHFHPDNIRDNIDHPLVRITGFKINNQSVPIRGSLADTLSWISPLSQHITYTEKIELPWHQNDISFDFAALNYYHPEKNQYRYRLKPYNKDWIYKDAQQPNATYTNLDPGKYVLEFSGTNNDGHLNEEGAFLEIVIHPPWWATWWAYVLYAVLILLAFLGLRNYELRRYFALSEARRLKELDSFKTRLYTNITHEFRTPLTIILGMARQIKDNPKKWYTEGLQMITRNGRQLLSLVNQMLDLSKLDKGKLKLHMQQGEIIGFIHYLAQSFESLAAGKHIQLHFIKEIDRLDMDFDPDQLTKVVSNLLSNAVKFTPEAGQIYVMVRNQQEYLEVHVKDTGPGIAPEELAHIFDRFYQVDPDSYRGQTGNASGTGLGLALTKELIQLMSGEIRVQSKVGEGTDFIVILPISRSAPKADHVIIPESQNEWRTGFSSNIRGTLPGKTDFERVGSGENIPSDNNLPVILLIEDNRDVLIYLASCLEADYQLEFAMNGKEGIEQALEIVPDIIISDVMMPEKDGYEVCAALKEDIRTSHIPIILLTAKADRDGKLEGLKSGADAYLAKPFDKEELNIRLEKLLHLRQQLQAHFSNLQSRRQAEEQILSKEDQFLTNLRDVIEENLLDEGFGIAQLCRKIGISRTQLHNKLKALTGQSTSVFIRAIRLEKAKELLRTSDLNISEVAYDVGFRTHAYFTQVFSEEVGVAPSRYRNKE